MSVAIPMCQLVSYSETHTCISASPLVGNEDVILTEIIAVVMLIQGWNDLDFKANASFEVFSVFQ